MFPNDYTFCKTLSDTPDRGFRTFVRMTTLLLALALLYTPSVVWSAPGLSSALHSQCARAPQIVIKAHSTKAKLVQQQPRGSKSALRSGWVVQGLTKFNRDTQMSFEWERRRDRSGTCLRLKKLQIVISNGPPQVWLAPAVKRNACLKKVVLAHELKHVAHHKAYSDQLLQQLNRKLSSLIQGKTHRIVSSPMSEANAKKHIERIGKLAVLKIQKPLERVAKHKDRSIDTPENYAKELARCGL